MEPGIESSGTGASSANADPPPSTTNSAPREDPFPSRSASKLESHSWNELLDRDVRGIDDPEDGDDEGNDDEEDGGDKEAEAEDDDDDDEEADADGRLGVMTFAEVEKASSAVNEDSVNDEGAQPKMYCVIRASFPKVMSIQGKTSSNRSSTIRPPNALSKRSAISLATVA